MEIQYKINAAIDSGLFENAHLETDEARIKTVLIPRFRPRFPILIWDNRMFMIYAGVGYHTTPIYKECFAYTVVPIPGVAHNAPIILNESTIKKDNETNS